ncbi:protein Aatf-like [Malaya genurostris]|uniref:protein Aatf-like n=1 Tax=Malaya genurostris TaxID=325434 RepID=UPI0026F3E5E7|nr:protein Aatf-like [Malaya genurostris]
MPFDIYFVAKGVIPNKQFAATTTGHDDDSDNEETRPRFSEFAENDDFLEKAASGGLSDFRKQNVKSLDAVDRKYQGQVSSRQDVFSSDTDDEESADSENGQQQPGAFVKLRPSQVDSEDDKYNSEEDDGSDYLDVASDQGESNEDEEEDDDDDEEEDEEDFTLGEFLGQGDREDQTLIQEEKVQKGICVQNQLKMWERLLEIRIKMQSSLITANSLPHEDKYNRFRENPKFLEASNRVVRTVESTLNALLELQEFQTQRFSETKDLLKSGTKRKLKDRGNDEESKSQRLNHYESSINANYANYKPYRNDVIQKWHDRTKASSNTKNAHQSFDIIQKIENSMLAKGDLIRKSQLYRGGYELFEKPDVQSSGSSGTAVDAEDTPEPIYDEEIFDGSDFYHALLRELIEYKSNTVENPQEINAKLAELQKLRSKMKKQVDTRASKGRKIRYVVHKKMVNFTAPEDNHEWTDEAKDELFSSLFGATLAE